MCERLNAPHGGPTGILIHATAETAAHCADPRDTSHATRQSKAGNHLGVVVLESAGIVSRNPVAERRQVVADICGAGRHGSVDANLHKHAKKKISKSQAQLRQKGSVDWPYVAGSVPVLDSHQGDHHLQLIGQRRVAVQDVHAVSQHFGALGGIGCVSLVGDL